MTIHKFPFTVAPEIAITMPTGAEILSLQVQRNVPCFWAYVDETNMQIELRRFRIYGTGELLDDPHGEYIGTVLLSSESLVWHVFEVLYSTSDIAIE